jgi:hypothetical protein
MRSWIAAIVINTAPMIEPTGGKQASTAPAADSDAETA